MNALPFWKPSSDLGKQVAPRLDLQLFLFGRDIAHPEGNQLLGQGFTRTRSSEASDRCSVYSLGPVTLWGFGLVWRDTAGTLYLPRTPYAPRLLPDALSLEGVWSKRDLPAAPPPKTPDAERLLRDRLAGAFTWLAEYERDAWERDPSWRRESVRAWGKKRFSPETLAREWESMAQWISNEIHFH